jgi:hypothetical protein
MVPYFQLPVADNATNLSRLAGALNGESFPISTIRASEGKYQITAKSPAMRQSANHKKPHSQ